MNQSPKHTRSKLFIAILITLGVLIGLDSNLFISSGILSHVADKPRIELDALHLSNLGFDNDQIEKDLNKIVSNMSNAQQANHFFLGIISGLVFSHPVAGLTVGLLKESADFLNNYGRGLVNRDYSIDAVVDTIFWSLGGFVGFYLLISMYELFKSNGIHNPKSLLVFLKNKTFRKKSE